MYCALFLLTLLACTSRVQTANTFNAETPDTTQAAPPVISDGDLEDSLREAEPDAFLDCFVVIADTGTNYFSLREQMLQLPQDLKQPIDTLGRTFGLSEGAIVYADSFATEEDNSYFPRRYPDNTLSLEYLRAYADSADRKTIALVTGIFGEKKDADEALAKLKKTTGKAFLIPATVYLGCMN